MSKQIRVTQKHATPTDPPIAAYTGVSRPTGPSFSADTEGDCRTRKAECTARMPECPQPRPTGAGAFPPSKSGVPASAASSPAGLIRHLDPAGKGENHHGDTEAPARSACAGDAVTGAAGGRSNKNTESRHPFRQLPQTRIIRFRESLRRGPIRVRHDRLSPIRSRFFGSLEFRDRSHLTSLEAQGSTVKAQVQSPFRQLVIALLIDTARGTGVRSPAF